MNALLTIAALAAANALAPVHELGITFAPEQLLRLQAGEPVVSVYQEADRTEIVTLAAVRVSAPAAALVACARDPRCLRGHPDTDQAGRLPAQPSPADFEALRLPESVLDGLEECRVGRCSVRLAQGDIERVQSVPWGGAGAAAAATSLVRDILAALAAEYTLRGDRALLVFADRPVPVSSEESTAVLLSRPLPVLDAVPELRGRIVAGFTGTVDAPVVDEYLSWFNERAYRRQLLGLHHVVVARVADGGGDLAVVASKQIYASSFTNASLELVALATAEGGGGGVLLWASRSRTDVRASGFNFVERLLLRRVVGGRVAGRLAALKSRLER